MAHPGHILSGTVMQCQKYIAYLQNGGVGNVGVDSFNGRCRWREGTRTKSLPILCGLFHERGLIDDGPRTRAAL